MKKTLTLLMLFYCIVSAKSQIASDCNVPNALSNHYDWDVKHLALTRIFAQNSADTNSIEISQVYQDTIWEGIAAIYNLTTIPQRDSVFDMFCVHQYGSCVLFNDIVITIDISYSWTSNWQNLITNTGNQSIDSLLANYGFHVTSYWSAMHRVTLSTNQNINVKPLLDSLETFAGVVSTSSGNYIGDGDDIYYSNNGTERLFNFKIGFGDCDAGCIDSYLFKFKVFNDCSVEYLGSELHHSTPEPIPSPIFCNITNSSIKYTDKNIEIFPNPTFDNISIKSQKHAKVEIINTHGQIVRLIEINDEYTDINLSGLSKGIYTFRIMTEKEIAINKIVKL